MVGKGTEWEKKNRTETENREGGKEDAQTRNHGNSCPQFPADIGAQHPLETRKILALGTTEAPSRLGYQVSWLPFHRIKEVFLYRGSQHKGKSAVDTIQWGMHHAPLFVILLCPTSSTDIVFR